MGSRPAAGGGRWVDVDPERLARWVEGFAARHGPAEPVVSDVGVALRAPDGAVAEIHAPPGVTGYTDLPSFVAASLTPHRLGLLLARKGAVAVGIALGDRIEASKVDTSYVQSRTAAGGWSQQRFARRRENQAKAAAGDAADLAARVLLPAEATLAALVCGGDRRTVDTILTDRRLAPLAALRAERHLQVPDPRHAVLVDAIRAARAVSIHLPPP
ncbi:acVLRF1 family peptidyl-tRNA hydrolase [Phytohabitans sp. ZYX-F-186]|uniref:AcVLRF1 family peptidyl-tRNA hydrolase n=1 Tax=Phytohabitans maris TaxID=3071409 RepID=A0ABU0ZB04_9ACTN|nr:acVLRF1 family peptidyl-tRNA hydrolase [Phytohabitans sp. ZYX-F-186]MDQ7904249.1 acVLRF1 family peptidyl-tRNA hydrolase [Phytohabitans sp. ZYX-F-186]